MKVYLIQNSGVEHNSLLGFYIDKKLAERDMASIAKRDNYKGGTFEQRWVKCGEFYYEQSRSRRGKKKYPAWESPRAAKKSGWIHGTMYVAEYEIQEHSLEEMVSAIKEWQKSDQRFKCPENTKHKMVAAYIKYPTQGIGLKCTGRDCRHSIEAHNPILGLVHATFLRNRAQATEARRLRSVRKA